jgi:hypothetical protein
MHVDVLIQTYYIEIHMFKVYDRFYKNSYKQRQISLKDLRGIDGTANTLRIEISITNEGPWGIGGTANTPWV